MAETLTKPSTSSPDASGDRDKSRGRSSPAQENLQGLEKVFIPYEGFLSTSAVKEQLRRSVAEPVQTAPDDLAAETAFLDALLGTSMLEPPIERHAEIMSDPRFSHPANAPTSSRIVNRLHQTYGNGHVQTVMAQIQARGDERCHGHVVRKAARAKDGIQLDNEDGAQQTLPKMDIQYGVQLIPQVTGTSCWAASAAMVVGWRDSMTIDPEELARGTGLMAAYVQGITTSEVPTLARVFRLKAEPPQAYSVEGVYRMLQKHGPLWLTLAAPYLHVVVVTGMTGDGTPDGTFVMINDPEPVGTGSRPVGKFSQVMFLLELAPNIHGEYDLLILHS